MFFKIIITFILATTSASAATFKFDVDSTSGFSNLVSGYLELSREDGEINARVTDWNITTEPGNFSFFTLQAEVDGFTYTPETSTNFNGLSFGSRDLVEFPFSDRLSRRDLRLIAALDKPRTATELFELALLGDVDADFEFSIECFNCSAPRDTPVTLSYTAPSAVVPIPAAVWLFGTGLFGLVGFSKRRKK